MSSHNNQSDSLVPLDLSKWRMLPNILIVVGLIGAVAGYFVKPEQFAFSWLLAFMFFLSLGLGGLGLTILHHLFDASWSVPIRRITEQLANLLRYMWLLWLPIGLLSPTLYKWMREVQHNSPDLATQAKYPLFTVRGFWIISAICLFVWWWLPGQLRKWSLKQDETGSAECTFKMRRYSAVGVFLFALSLTFGAIMWVKALEHEWFSTMYGVYYFAGSMWMTLATVYVIVLILQRQGPLKLFVHEKTYYFLGSLFFAFTVFYAYVTFFQYFIIWNANMPEETFWFVLREKGTWWYIGQLLIFGHFFLPFVILLRIDNKLKLAVMVPLFIWAWLMHYADMSFNILPVRDPANFRLDWCDVACMALFGGVLSKIFLKALNSHPILPQKDPRFAESQDIYVAPAQHTPDQFVEAATGQGIDTKRRGSH